MKHLSVRLAAVMCVVSCATLAAVELRPVVRDVQTTDQNGDGRPDVWRHYDARGQVTKVDVDTNFDGKPDVEEYYERGVLVRRESDRNFNGQADLVEEFDATTHGQTRSVVDIDYDGTADLLVLFRDGRPVFSKRTDSKPSLNQFQPAGHQNDTTQLVPLTDPFQSETAIRTMHTRAGRRGMCRALDLRRASFPALVDTRPIVAMCTGRARPSCLPVRLDAAVLPRSPRAPPSV